MGAGGSINSINGVSGGPISILANPAARLALINFIQNDVTMTRSDGGSLLEKLLDFNNATTPSEGSFLDPFDVASESGYLIPTKEDFSYSGVRAGGLQVAPNHSILPVLLTSIFPLFLKSPYYEAYVEQQLTETKSQTMETEQVIDHIGRDGRLDAVFDHRAETTDELILSALKVFDVVEKTIILDDEIAASTWLESLITATEDIPVCVSLATARADRPGFPLIYVNRHFEATTLYTRDEIIGQNCKYVRLK